MWIIALPWTKLYKQIFCFFPSPRYSTKEGIGSLKVDDGPITSKAVSGRLRGIQLYDAWYIGGVPPNVTMSKLAAGAANSPSLVGSIRDLEINGEIMDFEGK